MPGLSRADGGSIDRAAAGSRCPFRPPDPDLEGLVIALERRLHGAIELRRERTRELPADRMGDGDAARRRRLLQADGEAYRGAEAVIALHDHVGERDAEAGNHRPLARDIARGHRALELDRPFDRGLDALEFDKGAIAHRLEDGAAMSGHGRPQDLAPDARQFNQRPALILIDEARETGHVDRGEHREPPWRTSHRATPSLRDLGKNDGGSSKTVH